MAGLARLPGGGAGLRGVDDCVGGWPTEQPEADVIAPGSGGVRKPCWGLEGRGKRGGLRVIYYPRSARGELWMLTIYAKNVQEYLSESRVDRASASHRGRGTPTLSAIRLEAAYNALTT